MRSTGDPIGTRKLALGAAPLGNLFHRISDAEAETTLNYANASAIDLIDTAPFYGHGRSELRVGHFVKKCDSSVQISTKVGRVLDPCPPGEVPDHGFADPLPFRPVFDYSEAGVTRSFQSSLERLGVEQVNTLLLHDIGQQVHRERSAAVLEQALSEALPTMRRWQAEGRAANIGLGVNEWEVCAEVLAQQPLDVILLAGRYSLLEQGAAGFLENAHAAGTRIYAGGVFNSGLLAGGLTYNYAAAPEAMLARCHRLAEVCVRYDVPLPAAALQFVAAHPAVERVVVGMRSATEVREVVAWLRLPVPPELWTELRHLDLIPEDAPVPC